MCTTFYRRKKKEGTRKPLSQKSAQQRPAACVSTRLSSPAYKVKTDTSAWLLQLFVREDLSSLARILDVRQLISGGLRPALLRSEKQAARQRRRHCQSSCLCGRDLRASTAEPAAASRGGASPPRTNSSIFRKGRKAQGRRAVFHGAGARGDARRPPLPRHGRLASRSQQLSRGQQQ
jgi:hypothetical protein